MTAQVALPADGLDVAWRTWDDQHAESLRLTWENEAWTASGHVGRERIQYVVRLSPSWQVRQLILFRDLDEPDLWLATDGHARWGEMNGAHRPELDGCVDIDLTCTPFTNTIPIRRLPLDVGDSAELPVVVVDVETLAVVPHLHRYERVADRRWRHVDRTTGVESAFDVDEFGLPIDQSGAYRRVTPEGRPGTS